MLVATSLNNLAGFYYAQGKYAKAEPLYKRSLAITEKALGKDHPNVADVLENMAKLYKKIGKKDQPRNLKNVQKRFVQLNGEGNFKKGN